MSASFFYLPERLLIRVTGSDRLRYLNGQVTNDLRKLVPGEAMQACLLTPKGKLSAVVWVTLHEQATFLEAPIELFEDLPARLERYLIADDVNLEIIPSESEIHVFGALLEESSFQKVPGVLISRLHLPGKDIKISELPVGFFEEHQPLSQEDVEAWRIEQAVPQWGKELTPDRLPPEAYLERRAIDYNKGCYVGQEVISRLRSVGHVNRLLVSLITKNSGEELVPGMKLFDLGTTEKSIGFITSVATESMSGKCIALGYVSRDNALLGKQLFAVDENSKRTCEVVVRK